MRYRSALFTSTAVLLMLTTTIVSADTYEPTYCRDYRPSMSQLSIPLPSKLIAPKQDEFASMRTDPDVSDVTKLNLPPAPLFSDAGIRFALVANFVQQLTVVALADEKPFLSSLQIMPMAEAIRDAMGYGMEGTRLREPGQKAEAFENFKIEYIDVEEPLIQSDGSRTVFVSKGVVRNIVKSSLATSFGGLPQYDAFMAKLLGSDATPGNATDISRFLRYRADYVDASVFPLGEILQNAASDGERNELSRFSHYSELIVGQFLFVGAHEIGHERLKHREDISSTDCATFRKHEREADKFAAEALADFNFSMAPTSVGEGRITDFEPFFLNYRDAGFTDQDVASSCAYDSPEQRRADVTAAYEAAVTALGARTFGGVDYASSEPRGVWCNDGSRTWLQEFR